MRKTRTRKMPERTKEFWGLFAEIWNTSWSCFNAAKKMGLPARYVATLVLIARKNGMQLKRMTLKGALGTPGRESRS